MEIIFDAVIQRIKAQMDKRGETIYAFAKALGLSQQTTDAYMNGRRKPSLDFIYRVCSVCDCSANELLGLREPAIVASPTASRDIERLRADAAQVCIRADSFTAAIDNLKETLQRFTPQKH